MPKLTQEQIQAAKQQNAERGISDEPKKPLVALPCGNGEAYVYKLVACTEGPVKSDPTKTKRQWTWELTLDDRYHPDLVGAGYLEKIWHYTSCMPGDEWAITKMFHHFGYSNDTETDELINDEATVLIYPTVEIFNNAPKMKARRFAYHDEAEYPQVQGSEPPFGGANDPHTPQDDPWATTPEAVPADLAKTPEVPAPAAAPVIPPQAPAADEDDTW
jgi:hypothetical protein